MIENIKILEIKGIKAVFFNHHKKYYLLNLNSNNHIIHKKEIQGFFERLS